METTRAILTNLGLKIGNWNSRKKIWRHMFVWFRKATDYFCRRNRPGASTWTKYISTPIITA